MCGEVLIYLGSVIVNTVDIDKLEGIKMLDLVIHLTGFVKKSYNVLKAYIIVNLSTYSLSIFLNF